MVFVCGCLNIIVVHTSISNSTIWCESFSRNLFAPHFQFQKKNRSLRQDSLAITLCYINLWLFASFADLIRNIWKIMKIYEPKTEWTWNMKFDEKDRRSIWYIRWIFSSKNCFAVAFQSLCHITRAHKNSRFRNSSVLEKDNDFFFFFFFGFFLKVKKKCFSYNLLVDLEVWHLRHDLIFFQLLFKWFKSNLKCNSGNRNIQSSFAPF